MVIFGNLRKLFNRCPRLADLASVKLTICLLILIASTVLLGAWCPQEGQVGKNAIVEQFGQDTAERLIVLGIADIFHTPWFLGLIALLTLNMVACSMQRVFPKVRLLRKPLPFLAARDIEKLPVKIKLYLQTEVHVVLFWLEKHLRQQGYSLSKQGNNLAGEWGKFSRLAPTITHIGLLTLLLGVSISSWTGFNGFQVIKLGDSMKFAASEHSKLWFGKLPTWCVQVDATRRENYENGQPKQWYSSLSVLKTGAVVQRQEISVNNPLSYEGVDIYQASWGLAELVLSIHGRKINLDLRPMGNLYAAFLPLEQNTILIFSVRNVTEPMRVFAKIPEWQGPRLLTTLARGKEARLGGVDLKYENVVPATGLQYKCDPGLPVTLIAFGFIVLGILLAAVPHKQIWVSAIVLEGTTVLLMGGFSHKAKRAFTESLDVIAEKLRQELETKSLPKLKDTITALSREKEDVGTSACLH